MDGFSPVKESSHLEVHEYLGRDSGLFSLEGALSPSLSEVEEEGTLPNLEQMNKTLGKLFAKYRYENGRYIKIAEEVAVLGESVLSDSKDRAKETSRLRARMIELYSQGNREFIKGFTEISDRSLLYKLDPRNQTHTAEDETTCRGISLKTLGQLVAVHGNAFIRIAKEIKILYPTIDKADLTLHCKRVSKRAFYSQNSNFMEGYANDGKNDPTQPFRNAKAARAGTSKRKQDQYSNDDEIEIPTCLYTGQNVLVADLANAYVKHRGMVVRIAEELALQPRYSKIFRLYYHIHYTIRKYNALNEDPKKATPESRLFLEIIGKISSS